MKFLRDNGLTIALLILFAASLCGHIMGGLATENAERVEDHQLAFTLGAYLASGTFLSSLFENWESEFLQMGTYVVLTAYLIQRGSPESKDPDKDAPQDRAPVAKDDAPGPVRKGGLALALYSHSLGLTLFGLFAISFVLHWINSARAAGEEALANHQVPLGLFEYLAQPQLWFESFQNWQSEFLSTAVLIVLGIFLREKGSPESKPVDAPHSQTGD